MDPSVHDQQAQTDLTSTASTDRRLASTAMSNSTTTTSTTTMTASIGFPALALARLHEASKLVLWLTRVHLLAMACLVIFGTLASLPAFRGSMLMYRLFHYVPYALVALTIVPLLYIAFLIDRYRLAQLSILRTNVALSLLALLICALWSLSAWWWAALALWIGLAFWFKAVLARFDKFVTAETQPTKDL